MQQRNQSRRNQSRRISLLLILALATLSAAFVVAQKITRPDVRVQLSGSVRRGQETISLDKAGQLSPGEVLRWTISSQNNGNEAASGYQTTGVIPRGTVFVAGSAGGDGGARVTYSIDAGKSYHEKPLIEERQPDGTMKKVPAPVTLYTNVRYEWKDPLAPEGRLEAFYESRVR